MTRLSLDVSLRVIILSLLLQNCHGSSYQRLIRRRLRSNEIKGSDDIRNIISASLTANEPAAINNNKRDTLSDQGEDQGSLDRFAIENNAAVESRDSSLYDNDADEDDEVSRQKDDVEYKRRMDSESSSNSEPVSKTIDQSDLTVDDESDLRDIKDNVKREVKNEEEYDEDDEVSSDSVDTSNVDDRKDLIGRSTIGESSSNELKKIDNPRDTSAVSVDSDLDYEKQIENQIQQRIDTIKEDIKREIEKKQMVREIEANNEKYDEIMDLRSEDDEVAAEEPLDSSKRSISVANNNVDSSEDNLAMRSKRSDLKNEVQPETPSDASKRSIFVANNGVDSAEENVASKSKRSEVKSEVDKNVPLVLPVKKRCHPRHVVIVERDTRKRKSRSAILIPERGHAEVKDDLPADLTLDPNLRMARSYDRDPTEQEVPRSLRSATKREDNLWGRHRRDMSEDSESEKFAEIDEMPGESSNFLFPSRGKSDELRSRRRRSRGHDRTRSIDRGKGRKHPSHSRHHRAIRESSLNDSDLDEERDKRASSLDEDAALEYKESFGGFPSDSGGALGRFKRIKRSTKIS